MTPRLLAQRRAAKAALSLRRRLSISPHSPICPYDVAEKLGISTRLVDLPSMEGMYSNQPRPTILISALRPAPRRNFTCSHEIGHHIFGHGHQVDPSSEEQPLQSLNAPIEEVMADRFAGELMMPSLGVRHAFSVRKLDPGGCTPEEFYRVSCQFGVGYSTLAYHLTHTIKLIDDARRDFLLRFSPSDFRDDLLQRPTSGRFIPVDTHWRGIAVDIEVGDHILLPVGTRTEGAVVEIIREIGSAPLARATRPGIGRAECGTDWSVFVRVAPREFVGLSRFRHLEDDDDG